MELLGMLALAVVIVLLIRASRRRKAGTDQEIAPHDRHDRGA